MQSSNKFDTRSKNQNENTIKQKIAAFSHTIQPIELKLK